MFHEFPLTHDVVTALEQAGVTSLRQLVRITSAMKLKMTVELRYDAVVTVPREEPDAAHR